MTTITPGDFLAARFRDNDPDQRIELRSFAPDGTPGPRRWFADPRDAARYAATLPQRLAVHYGANPRVEGGGKKEHVTAIVGAYADLDFSRYAAGEAGAWAALDTFALAPTWVIRSGGGLHAYWDLRAPITDRAQFAPFEALLSRLAAAVGGDPAVAEVARVLRFPGSYNSKPEYGEPRPVAIVRHNPAALYALTDFLAILPAPVEPARPTWSPPAGGSRAANRDEPTSDDIREWLRFIAPTGDYKDHWLKVLAAVQSVSPGAAGVALCEEWSPGKPGEIARKFASFKRPAGGAGAAGVGTLVYLAQQGGWEPPRHAPTPPSTDPGAPDDAARLLAERDTLIATLRADAARLGDQLRREQEEGARMVAAIAELAEERDFYRRCLDCPDPVVGRALPALAEDLHRSYQRGHTLVIEGQEFARLNLERAEQGKAVKRGAIATASRRLGADTPHHERETTHNRDGRDVKTTLHYLACPVEERASVARLGLGLLARAAPKSRHQGRKPAKVMPPAVAAQDAPVRREQHHIEKFFSLRDDTLLATATTIGNADYWTADGEQLTQEQARTWQIAHGARPAVETQHHAATPLRRFVGDQPQAARGVEPQQTSTNDRGVEPQQWGLPLDTPGVCQDPECGDPAVEYGYCRQHSPAYVGRYVQPSNYAAGAG